MDNYKAPPQNYKHLDLDRRETLALSKARGLSVVEIAKAVECHRSSIYRELKRNMPQMRKVEYRANRSQLISGLRKQKSHERLRLKTREIREYVQKKIREKWSPEQIANRLKIDNPGWVTNYESIYQFIYLEFREGIEHLRHGHKTRRKRASGQRKRVNRIPNRTMIDQRPKEIEARDIPGHLEADTMVSRKSKTALMVVVDRCTRITILTKLPQKTMCCMDKSLTERLIDFPQNRRLSITYDNGTENALHEKTNAALGTKSYFCMPYHSWEKGTIENTNGLVRQYLPKGCDFSKISEQQIMFVENALNNRPRKCLGYHTPMEADSAFVALRA